MNMGERPGKLERGPGAKPKLLDDATLAIEALRFFADDPERADRFFTWSGLDAGTLRAAASRPGFGASVLEYLMQDEPLLLSFAQHAGLKPADVAATHQVTLAGLYNPGS